MDALADMKTKLRISKKLLGWIEQFGITEVLGIVAATVRENSAGRQEMVGREGEWDFAAEELTELVGHLESGPLYGTTRNAILAAQRATSADAIASGESQRKPPVSITRRDAATSQKSA